MKRKPIRINWDDLEAAFDNPNEELVYYLDRVNGHVLLEGEGEERDDDDESDDYASDLASAGPSTVVDETRAYIAPLHEETKIDWLQRFIDETNDLAPSFIERIRAALDSDEPKPLVLEALRDDADGHDRWYLYRAERLHERIEEWLDENGVVPTDPPPWS